MNSSLYADFTLTIDNCHVEPIHRPIAIQGRGHILVFDKADSNRLFAMNSKCAAWLTLPASTLWNCSAETWLSSSLLETFKKLQSAAGDEPIGATTYQCDGEAFDVLLHKHSGHAFLEFERSLEPSPNLGDAAAIGQQMRACRTLEKLFSSTAAMLKELLGYDRVMIYQFDADFHGSVVGEAKAQHLEPYIGLHYPATDIPPLARELFLKNRSRCISDVHQANDLLLFNPKLGAEIPLLDLSMCQHRATSPIHIEYLKHMGVRATFSIAIVLEGKLWGLVACHHYSPRALPFAMRNLAETLAELFSVRLSDLQREVRKRTLAHAEESEQAFLDQICIDDYYKLELAERSDCLLQLCQADGAAVVSLDIVSCTTGIVPPSEELLTIRDWLVTLNENAIFATDNLAQVVPGSIQPTRLLGGMLAACVSEISRSYLIWFRLPQCQVTNWAGDPSKTLTSETVSDSDEIRLSPRKSFAKWQESVADKSLPWLPDELAMVERIRSKILKKEFQRTASIVMRNRQEFMQLIYAASHDLQEPLRTQLNYLDLLGEELRGTDHSQWLHFVSRANKAVHRMQALIGDLLDYASLGTESKREQVELNALLVEIEDDLMQAVKKNQATIQVDNLPSMKGSRPELKQLFQNLLSNAIKYVAPGTIPRIRISAKQEGKIVVFAIEDNGIGIEKVHFQKIFLMFQRLHGKEQYDGTGIGLALCKKIVENYDGKIWVTSTVGMGSTFWLKFHASSFS